MPFQFTALQVTQIQSARDMARDALGASPTMQGAYAPAYELVFDMITDAVGEPEAGVEAGAWAFLRGVPDVNRGVGDFSTFIREYSSEQYRIRFGEDHVTPAQLAQLVQNTSNKIADNILTDIITPRDEGGVTANYLPDASRIAIQDAQAAHTSNALRIMLGHLASGISSISANR